MAEFWTMLLVFVAQGGIGSHDARFVRFGTEAECTAAVTAVRKASNGTVIAACFKGGQPVDGATAGPRP